MARKVVQLVLGRLDARTASYGATQELMQRFFPADYRVLLPGADPPAPREPSGYGPTRILFVDDEERAALRLFLRALRRLDPAIGVGGDDRLRPRPVEQHAAARRPAGARALRDARRAREADALAAADILVAASDGAAPAPGLVLRAINAQAVPLASRLAVYEEVSASAPSACCSSRATSTRSPPSCSG